MGRPPSSAASSAAAAAPVRGIPPASASACLLLMLACLAALLAVSEQHPRSANATEAHGGLWKGRPEQTPPNRDAPKKEVAAKDGFFNASSGSAAEEAWLPVVASAAAAAAAAAASGGGVKESQLKPPAVVPVGSRGRGGGGGGVGSSSSSEGKGGGGGGGKMAPAAAGSPPGAGTSTISLRYLPGEADEEEKKEVPWEAPQSGHREGTGPLEALAEVASFAQPLPGGAWKFLDGKEGPPPPSPESQEEAGSGEPHAGASPGEGELAGGTTLPPPLPGATEEDSLLTGGRGLGRSSVGTDLLPDPLGGEAPAPPMERPDPPQQPRAPPDQDSAQKEEPLELWVDASSRSPAQGPPGRTDLTWLEAVTPPVAPATRTPKPSSDPLASEIIDIDYYDLFDGDGLGGEPGSDATKGRPSSEDKGMSWSLHDLYDDFTPFDESDFYPTTSFYTDGDDEDLEEPEEEEEEEEEEDEGGGLARDLEDENDYRIPTRATPKIQTVAQEAAEPTSRHRHLVPPLETFAVSGGSGLATPRPRPAEAGRDLSLSGSSGENATECRSGYVRHNTSCKSVCDTFPSYCHNGGQCYLVESLGAFCRCNTQDYIWHKGIRCESIITDFQVMCVAVGSAALVVLLLFMMTVFFAKKLYLLKTENNKLRKTKYRTPSELHNDNFSLSTIAEGSHPNDDPSAPHKLQDPLKSCLKEEESFNIQNSMSLKLENSKGDPDAADANCLQNNLT